MAEASSHPVCKACGQSLVAAKSYEVMERMFGSRSVFAYLECPGCASLQISAIPHDLAKYYPPSYYSLNQCRASSLARRLRAVRGRHVLGLKRSVLGFLLWTVAGEPYYADWLRRTKTHLRSRILDVGCGSGAFLYELADMGFGSLTGVDPFLSANATSGAVRLLQRHLGQVSGEYDFILMSQSLEHMDNPRAALHEARRLLSANGWLLVRVPVAGSRAWRTYGTCWVQLDAPRHLLIPSVQGMKALAKTAGLAVTEIVFDSNEFQFVGSEKYRRDLTLYQPDRATSGWRVRRKYRKIAKTLNRTGEGDQACFYLRKDQDLARC